MITVIERMEKEARDASNKKLAGVKPSLRDIMLVAWRYRRIYKEMSFAECLKLAWRYAKNNMRSFCVDLHDLVLAKRKETLKDFDVPGVFQAQTNGTRTQITFSGEWWEPYEWLFKILRF